MFWEIRRSASCTISMDLPPLMRAVLRSRTGQRAKAILSILEGMEGITGICILKVEILSGKTSILKGIRMISSEICLGTYLATGRERRFIFRAATDPALLKVFVNTQGLMGATPFLAVGM